MAESAPLFDDGRAERYDRIISRIVVGYEAMHWLARAAVLLEPDVRRVLVVGVGTGEETVALANDLPEATFVGVDVSADMLGLASEKIAGAGLAGRVKLVHGDTSHAAVEPFDVACDLLVSHFIPSGPERAKHFQEISCRLRPGGLLVESALVAGPYEPLWRSSLGLGFDPEKVDDIIQGFHDDIHAIDADQHLADMAMAGFKGPVEVFRSLFARMWTART